MSRKHALLYEQRRERLRALMAQEGLDALLISHPANRFYLSGFELHDVQINESSGRLLITASGQDWLCTDARYAEAAARLWEPERVFVYRGDAAGQINELARDKLSGSVGFEARAVTVDFFQRFSPGLDLELADGLVESLRAIKDAGEIAAIEEAVALNHKLMDYAPTAIVPGRTEYEIAWDIERFFRENGASELAFASIVAVGPNAALPHYEPGDQPVLENSPVLVDVGCRCKRYCSDQTRTFWAGNAPTPEFSRTLDQVQEAQRRALDILRPGLPVAEAYAAAWNYFDGLGLSKYFTHGLGHGVGLETHEAPSLNPRSESVLEAGMVVTVEPGLYYPEWGGARWEYMALITPDGCRIL